MLYSICGIKLVFKLEEWHNCHDYTGFRIQFRNEIEVIPFLNTPPIFASVWKNSSKNANTNVSAPSLISYCSKEPLSYAVHCTGVSFFSVVGSHSENQEGFSGLLCEKASLKFKDHKLYMCKVHHAF